MAPFPSLASALWLVPSVSGRGSALHLGHRAGCGVHGCPSPWGGGRRPLFPVHLARKRVASGAGDHGRSVRVTVRGAPPLQPSLLSSWGRAWFLISREIRSSVCSSQEREQVPPLPRRPPSGWAHCADPGRSAHVVLCVNSRIPIPPNTQLLPTAPTPAARRAPPPPTGASSPLKAWSRRPTTPEATGRHLVATGPGAAWLQRQCRD